MNDTRYCDHCGMTPEDLILIEIAKEAKEHAADPDSPLYLKAVDKHGNDVSPEVIEYILIQARQIKDLKHELDQAMKMLDTTGYTLLEEQLKDLQTKYDQLNIDHTKIWKDYKELKEAHDNIMGRVSFDQEGGIHER